MDRLRGEYCEEVAAMAPPAARDERRLQVRAYNFWASLLGDRAFPDPADLDPAGLPDFGPHGVLLDLAAGPEDPAIVWLGPALAQECGADVTIRRLSDVPGGSLLARITDHTRQTLANQAPVGFEAAFVNRQGATILYRGILLPFSRDQLAIDCIYGVVNWKEQDRSQEAETAVPIPIDPALDPAAPRRSAPLTEWADGPAASDADVSRGVCGEMAQGLRALPSRSLDDLGHSAEFTVLVARRDESGQLVLLGEVADDAALLARAAGHLLG
ncbi:hypothetical protein [Novosphingobium sp.]|uniref:PAS domain-containing protein n=1 Tax=Novosphingobium sp. TaxID=1874826 RepID=UPI0028AE1628|nr:hypothetical protein [Novosphingobium sp.]